MATGKPVRALMTSDSISTGESSRGQLSATVSVDCPAVVVCATVTCGIVAMSRSTPTRTWAFPGAAISASVEFIQMKLSVCSAFWAGVSGFGGVYGLPSALSTALIFSISSFLAAAEAAALEPARAQVGTGPARGQVGHGHPGPRGGQVAVDRVFGGLDVALELALGVVLAARDHLR